MSGLLWRDRIWHPILEVCALLLYNILCSLRFKRGGDIHFPIDGNFHHRHRPDKNNILSFYEPINILSKEFVDGVGKRIEDARKHPPKPYPTVIQDDIIDACANLHEAADEMKQKANSEVFDDTGAMLATCRHDIPLFMANIDTPGEQQKYAVALIDYLFSHIPSNANVVVFYDIGCVLHRSIKQVRKLHSIDV
jgi:hypothetical protein